LSESTQHLGEVRVGKSKWIPNWEMGNLEWAKGRNVFLNLGYSMGIHFHCGVSGPCRTDRVLARTGGVTVAFRLTPYIYS